MQQLRLIADDLTGALDSSCAFASEREPVIVGLPWRQLPTGPKIAITTESRDQTVDAAIGGVVSAAHGLNLATAADAVCFKKVDSVLRGHAIAETQAIFSAGNFDYCVFAPAFPEMGRTTVRGCQFVLTSEGVPTRVGPKFAHTFQTFGLASKVLDFEGNQSILGYSARLPAVLLVDAIDQETLTSRITGLFKQLSGKRVLWSGAGGLAKALGGTPLAARYPPVRCIIVGTNHPATIAQTVSLSGSSRPHDDVSNSRAPIPHLIAPALTATSGAETAERIREAVDAMEISDKQNTSLVVTGGATLSTVLQATGAEFLECFGEAITGIPISRVRGGRWDGVTVLSKSGGFGAIDIFASLSNPAAYHRTSNNR